MIIIIRIPFVLGELLSFLFQLVKKMIGLIIIVAFLALLLLWFYSEMAVPINNVLYGVIFPYHGAAVAVNDYRDKYLKYQNNLLSFRVSANNFDVAATSSGQYFAQIDAINVHISDIQSSLQSMRDISSSASSYYLPDELHDFFRTLGDSEQECFYSVSNRISELKNVVSVGHNLSKLLSALDYITIFSSKMARIGEEKEILSGFIGQKNLMAQQLGRWMNAPGNTSGYVLSPDTESDLDRFSVAINSLLAKKYRKKEDWVSIAGKSKDMYRLFLKNELAGKYSQKMLLPYLQQIDEELFEYNLKRSKVIKTGDHNSYGFIIAPLSIINYETDIRN